MTTPRHMDALNLADLPPASLTRVLLSIGSDALSRPIELPILVAKGRRSGPTLGLTAALHGNEINGIPVVQRVLHGMDLQALKGTVVGVLVSNIPGFLGNRRLFMDGWDLNHLFPGKEGGHSGQLYAHRLLHQVVSHLDVLVDLHTASAGRVNSLYVRADMSSPKTRHMAMLLRPQLIVHNPPTDGTLRGAAADLDVPAVTLEVGNPQRYNKDFIRRSVSGIRAILANQGMLRKRPQAPAPEPILCSQSAWMYTDVGGLLEILPELLDIVQAGDDVAILRNPFGDEIARYQAPHTGVVIGHSVNPVTTTGGRILHLGVMAPKEEE
ncbi:MAG: putative deacylase [Cognaticolwellia sp.]|jgi:predicted deacylase